MPRSLSELRDEVSSLQSALDKNQGKLDALMDSLKSEFKCKTLDQAKSLLKKLQDERSKKSEEVKSLLLQLEADVLAAEESMADTGS